VRRRSRAYSSREGQILLMTSSANRLNADRRRYPSSVNSKNSIEAREAGSQNFVPGLFRTSRNGYCRARTQQPDNSIHQPNIRRRAYLADIAQSAVRKFA
jgi:hypothetical protein